MDELVPVISGAVLGAIIWLTTTGKARFVLSVLAVIGSGAAATLSSGEYLESWIYLLLDFGEAALGLAAGYLIAAWLPRSRSFTRAARHGADQP